jgi:FKBP-type peptidyl-prolyl cis-trans isomerase
MAASNGQRVAAFLLALVFLLSTIGFTAYVILAINSDDNGIVPEQPQDPTSQQTDSDNLACGQETFAPEEPRSTPDTVTAEVPVTELQTIDVKEGTGPEVQPGDCVAALYYGTLASDGSRFDGNYDTGEPIEFSLNGVIAGWTEGIPGMKVGGVRRLVIPAEQAYGEQERPGIPADSDLVFEVEILSARQAQ